MRKHLLFTFLILFSVFSFSQEVSINGIVQDKSNNQALEGANIIIKGTQIGTVTNKEGVFHLKLKPNQNEVLLVSFLGYINLEVSVSSESNNITIKLEPTSLIGDEIVVSASRVSENIRTAPSSIQKITQTQIENASSGDYFQSLGNLRDIEIINNSIGFKVFNTRGFNSTAQVRAIQIIDGIDNQLPTINIVPGNMFGVSDIDISSIEVISGPASAIYGPNAMQGVLSYQTKNPFDHKGVSAEIKGGTRDYLNGQIRIGQTFFKEKLGVKIVASYMKAKDWQADYIYGNQGANPNIQMNIMGKMMENPSYADFVNYYSTVDPNASPFTKVMMPGYSEEELYDGAINNMKFSGSLYYRFTKDIQLKYAYSYGSGTSLFMGNNRAPLDGFSQQLHQLEFKGKGLTVHAFRSNDNTNDTYTLVGAGVNLGFASLGSVDAQFLPAYVNQVQALSNNYTNPLTPDQLNQAITAGSVAAQNSWLIPGTEAFNTAYDKIKVANPPAGAHYQSETTIYHIDGLYEYNFKQIDVNIGGSFRNTKPISYGSTFSDTLQQDGTYRQIDVSEYGGFVQGIGHLLNDNLKIYASIRMDKSDNYDLQLSPRLAAVASSGNHHFRLSAQSAFRAPVLTDQYQYLNRGSDIVLGNINGFDNCYSQTSIDQFYANGMDPNLLVVTQVAAVKPEQLKSIELGYNGTFMEKLLVEFNAYYSRYADFIAYERVGSPRVGIAGEQSGLESMMSGNYQKYSVATNIDQDVNTYGTSVGLSYFINNKYRVSGNYTYSNIDTANINSDVIPGFNTPKHKINLGIQGQNVFKNLGFNVNWKWVDSYYWEAVFASGPVPSYNTLDIQLHYTFPKIYSTFRIGGSNILGEEYIQAYAMPQIGAFWYASWTFDLGF